MRERLSITSVIEDGGSQRLGIWKLLWEKFYNSDIGSFFLGSGTGTVITFTGNYYRVAHNIYLETLVELGIIGVILLLFQYFSFFFKAVKNDNKVYASLMFAYIIMGLTLSIYRYKPLFLIFLIIMIHNKNIYIYNGKEKKGYMEIH